MENQPSYSRLLEIAVATSRKEIVNFLEKQLFRIPPVEDEVCHLTFDMWKDLKETILSGKYNEQ